MSNRRSFWSRCVIVAHIAIVVLMGFLVLRTHHHKLIRPMLILASGTSLFVLTGLVHEASHHLLSRQRWLNDLFGNMAGTFLLTPVSAYRALHLKHHQATNYEDDPNVILKSRWMLLFGAPTYILLTHRYALLNLRGRALARYLVELAGMLGVVALICMLPRTVREWSIIAPLVVVGVLQNVRIVTGHMDLPAGKYHDTWQLVLPDWLSKWVLHYDHHLEHHLKPRMNWYDLPALRASLADKPELPLHRVTLPQFFREVYFSRPKAAHSVQSGDAARAA